MAHSGRFGLSLRILAHLALAPNAMHTSAAIAESLGTNPVTVRRLFSSLSRVGLLLQRKGPGGGARLKLAPKFIGLGDVYAAVTADWASSHEKAIDSLVKRARQDAIAAMNDTTVAALAKKLRKSHSASSAQNSAS